MNLQSPRCSYICCLCIRPEIVEPVCRYVVKRVTKTFGDKKYYKAPKIQRLITSERLRRKRVRQAEKYESAKKTQEQIKNYKKQLSERRSSRFRANSETVNKVAATVNAKKTK